MQLTCPSVQNLPSQQAARVVVADDSLFAELEAYPETFATSTKGDDLAAFQYTSGTTRELPAAVKHTITVFTDIDCTYCRKLHSEIGELNKLGVGHPCVLCHAHCYLPLFELNSQEVTGHQPRHNPDVRAGQLSRW